MAWKRKSTSTYCSVDVDLTEFDEEQLLQGLIDAGWIDKTEAEAISKRAGVSDAHPVKLCGAASASDFEIAREEARRGRSEEAKIFLSRALGRDFDPIFRT